MAQQANPEIVQAIKKGAALEAIVLAAGVALYLITNLIWWLVGAAVVGAAVLLLVLAQAGAFSRPQ